MKTNNLLKTLAITMLAPAIASAQPEMLKDIATQGFATSSNPSGFMRAGNNVYFMAAENMFNSNLWITDGTEAGTTEATIDEYSTSYVNPLKVAFGDNVLLGTSTSNNLYFSDGTASGDVAILDDFAYVYDFGFNDFNVFTIGSELFFWANQTGSTTGAELYKTDGTVAGTSLFKEFNPGAGKGYAGSAGTSHCINASSDKAYVIAYDGDSNKLYVSDGSLAGTLPLQTLTPNYITQDPNFYPEVINGYIYAKTTNKVWSLNITSNVVTEITLPANILIVGTYHMNDKLYILLQDGLAKRDLYELDGTNLTLIADDFATSGGGIYPWGYTTEKCEANGKFYFTVHPSGLQSVQLWITDGTSSGTVKVLDSIAVSGNGVDNIYTCNDRTYYYQSGAVHTLFEINPTTHNLEELLVDISYAPFLDEETCRFYFGYNDSVAMVEPHYLEMGAPASTGPNPPTNLSATTTSRSNGTISLSWIDNSTDEDGFYLERGTDGSSFTQIADLGTDVTTYDDTTGLVASTQYFYQVRAYNTNGTSAYSNIADATTNALSVEEKLGDRITLYPNPASNELYINVESSGSFNLINLEGVLVQNGRLNSDINVLDIKSLISGVYFIEIQTESGNTVRKVIIQ